MLERGKPDCGVVEMVDTESLVPAEHLLRKIDAAVDFNRLYEMAEPLYSEDNGRPGVDPVVLFKMVLIQHLYGHEAGKPASLPYPCLQLLRWSDPLADSG